MKIKPKTAASIEAYVAALPTKTQPIVGRVLRAAKAKKAST